MCTVCSHNFAEGNVLYCTNKTGIKQLARKNSKDVICGYKMAGTV